MHSPTPVVSVILCTHNPHPAQLDWALAALDSQTLPKDRYEVIVVDNRSQVPLVEREIRGIRGFNLRLISESRLGLTHARCKGIRAAKASLLVFVDDDNFLFPDYLEQALQIADREPEIGHFGGSAAALYEKPVAPYLAAFLPTLGIRDYGQDAITSRESRWGHWEPIGAGMVCRRGIAEAFVCQVEANELADQLGRKGRRLTSGEDSLFARITVNAGFACSYQPALRLFHLIRSDRLRPFYLARMQYWQGRAHVILEVLSGRPPQREAFWKRLRTLWKNSTYRFQQDEFRIALIAAFWHVGCYLETNAQTSEAVTITPQAAEQVRRPGQ